MERVEYEPKYIKSKVLESDDFDVEEEVTYEDSKVEESQVKKTNTIKRDERKELDEHDIDRMSVDEIQTVMDPPVLTNETTNTGLGTVAIILAVFLPFFGIILGLYLMNSKEGYSQKSGKKAVIIGIIILALNILFFSAPIFLL